MPKDYQSEDCNEEAVKSSKNTSMSEKMCQDYSIKSKKQNSTDEP